MPSLSPTPEPRRTRPRALVFDFDGTLVDSRIDFPLMRERVLVHLSAWGLKPDPAVEMLILETIHWARKNLRATSPLRADQYFAEAMALLWEIERPFCNQARLFPGVADALRAAATAGVSLGIITRNSRAGVGLVMARNPLPIAVIVTRDDLMDVKPHPRHLLQALQAMDVPAAQTWLIGDHPTDVACGLAAGAHAGAVLTGGTPAAALLAAGAELVCPDSASLVHALLRPSAGE
ncbi:MAG TPA: HAD-IA family hydrolase [Armatimonadota bacterium]|jgi:phosphoglycolate phosphatase